MTGGIPGHGEFSQSFTSLVQLAPMVASATRGTMVREYHTVGRSNNIVRKRKVRGLMRDGSGTRGLREKDFCENSDKSLLDKLNESVEIKHLLDHIMRECGSFRRTISKLVCKCIAD